MEFKIEKKEVVEKHTEETRYMVMTEDELKEMFYADKQYFIADNVNYERVKEYVNAGVVIVSISFHGFPRQFTLKLKDDNEVE